MEAGKFGEYDNKEHHEQVRCINKTNCNELFEVYGLGVRYEVPLDCANKRADHRECKEVKTAECIEKKEQEVLSVPEADAIVDPGTMMIHI